jgi:hypothetical protein
VVVARGMLVSLDLKDHDILIVVVGRVPDGVGA